MNKWGLHFDVAHKEEKIAELEYKMGEPSFWDDSDYAQKITMELNGVKDSVEKYKALQAKYEDMQLLWEMGMEDKDESVYGEITSTIKSIQQAIDQLELDVMLSEEYDVNNAILTLHAGAGGTEAQDWTQMLLRMYGRWAERNGFSVETIDFLPGDEAGVKSATIMINGHNAYGYLKGEKGVHRLVRISPFDANARRHTSFSACDVMPEIDETVEVDINMADIRVDTYRASGAGGQHINKTDSAVRMTHLPTGTVAQCQTQRSQLQNRVQCMKLLRARLFELEQQKKADQLAEIDGEHQKIEWGSQIRSYVFQPYNMVKDHRTNAETGNTQAVMDGDLAMFIEAYLKAKANNEL
ncbi:peptide chain release factor 2 [Propionispira arboris]|uniref:Peptide chain release factor 2 n=1 Tax=Propionispira arboris TaxID=84035 RepID=A0A1H7CL52_9FIRM|nr:peptide chain release factor 2 [Propionispira arboris]